MRRKSHRPEPHQDHAPRSADAWQPSLQKTRHLTEINAGRNTAGVDGRVVPLAPQKAELADWVQHQDMSWTVRPVKRVFIPKANGKQRPLGIPTVPA